MRNYQVRTSFNICYNTVNMTYMCLWRKCLFSLPIIHHLLCSHEPLLSCIGGCILYRQRVILQEWMGWNHFKMNVDKTQLIWIGHCHNWRAPVPLSSEMTNLGLVINRELTMKEHVWPISTKYAILRCTSANTYEHHCHSTEECNSRSYQ